MTAPSFLARSTRGAQDLEQTIGKRIEADGYAAILKGDCAIYSPKGELAARLIRGAIPEDVADRVRPWLRSLQKKTTTNRGDYAGVAPRKRRRADGQESKTSESVAVPSAVDGFIDRMGGRFPYCRPCAVNAEAGWSKFAAFAQVVSEQFRRHLPDRWQAQMDEARRCKPDWIIPGTPFSTITVNNTFAGAVHRDAGDFKAGFGCIAVLRQGRYDGCYLGFPRYSAAFDLGDRDLLLFDPHEPHGNTQFVNAQGELRKDWERISIVLYLRSRLRDCGTPKQELERARQATRSTT